METKGKNTKVVTCGLALAGLLLVWTLATAGDLEPSAPPASTMKTLDEIYDAVVEGSSGISERQGYIKCVEVGADSTYTFFTVPAGKCFVLLKLNMAYTTTLTVDDLLFIGPRSFWLESELSNVVDFPDRCVLVNAGETLKAVNEHPTVAYDVSIVGYFYDVP
jgi:hypothetical protein